MATKPLLVKPRRRVLLETGAWLLLTAILAAGVGVGYGHGWASVLGALFLGGLSWLLLQRAVVEIRERLRFADLPAPLQAHNGRWITVIVLALLLLALWGLARVPNIILFLGSGAVVALAVNILRRAQEQLEPRVQLKIANDNSLLLVRRGASLLESLRAHGYELFTQCGGQGQCATCRVRVLQGPNNWGPLQRGILTPALLQQNYVLACQVQVESDMNIELFQPLVLAWPTLDGQPLSGEPKLVAAGRPQLSPSARRLRRRLPGFNCGACGYATCDAYAQALSGGQVVLNLCLPGGAPVRDRLQAEAEKLQLTQVNQSHA
ncbi:MAG TPA: 2Fe-2S iron-sulfur cluster binding domain-containing protein [Candidatus Fraserbacteria bacterium]|nr:2Fe-2S iron-sulfur cluster binding domain-containing protein [Candidatus Fraserbacteria bacterium]